ncbi:hypothetical protein [Pseudobdellovibrio sp. HCB154]|uniref:hypothetical protein n=1 Tax=Pseudobdellovibrio sp. HCB154 TaxID=3386277 RepID=UPI0039170769
MAKTIRLGPFSEPQINQIKEKIDPLGHPYKIEIDQDLVAKYQQQVASKNYYERHQEPVTPLGEFLFIEVSSESLLLIKKYLHDLGIPLKEDSHFLPDNELYCPKCEYTTTDLTLCATHRLPLVDYYTKVQLEKNFAPKSRLTNFILISLIAIFLIVVIIENF